MAGTPTPRLKLPLPAETDPADVPLDLSKLATALDSGGSGSIAGGVAYDNQGTLAQRPAAGVRGAYYFATDNGILYRDTGGAWVQLTPRQWLSASGDASGDGSTADNVNWSFTKSPTIQVPVNSGRWRVRANFNVANLNASNTACGLFYGGQVPAQRLAGGSALSYVPVALEGEITAASTLQTVGIGYKPSTAGQTSYLVNNTAAGVPYLVIEQIGTL